MFPDIIPRIQFHHIIDFSILVEIESELSFSFHLHTMGKCKDYGIFLNFYCRHFEISKVEFGMPGGT